MAVPVSGVVYEEELEDNEGDPDQDDGDDEDGDSEDGNVCGEHDDLPSRPQSSSRIPSRAKGSTAGKKKKKRKKKKQVVVLPASIATAPRARPSSSAHSSRTNSAGRK